MHKYQLQNIVVSLLMLLVLLVAVFSGLAHKADGDEIMHHLPAVSQYINQFPFFDLQSYHSASGPVPYMLWSIWGQVFGADLVSLRCMTVLLALFSIVLMSLLLPKEDKLKHAVLLGLVVFQPYFFARSFFVYTMIPSLFFGLLAIYIFNRQRYTKNNSYLILYILGMSLAVLSRQIYLSYALGVLAYVFLQSGIGRPFETLKKILPYFIPILVLLTLFAYWGSSNPPGFAANKTAGVNLLQIDFIFIFLGFWFFPLVLDNFKRLPKWLLITALLLSLRLYFEPHYLADASVHQIVYGNISGFIPRALLMASHFLPMFVINLIHVLLWFGGFIVIYLLARKVRELYSLIVFAHFSILLFVPQVWERYFLPIIPILWLALQKDMHGKKIYLFWLAIQILFTVFYLKQKLQF